MIATTLPRLNPEEAILTPEWLAEVFGGDEIQKEIAVAAYCIWRDLPPRKWGFSLRDEYGDAIHIPPMNEEIPYLAAKAMLLGIE